MTSSRPFQCSTTSFLRNFGLFGLTVLGFAGCIPQYKFSTDADINGKRTISQRQDGVTRRLEAVADVEIKDGKITKFPKAALVKLEESGDSGKKKAELRENGGILELWIEDNGSFRKGSPEEQTWVDEFLRSVTAK